MKRLLPWLISSACILAVAGSSSATQPYMDRLPAATHFRCLNCHAVQDPPASNVTLNPFGEAFKANGFKWDRVLATQGSDGDNCTNGFELGDTDGDGKLDPLVTAERSNPGELDCTLQLSLAAWTALKQLFR